MHRLVTGNAVEFLKHCPIILHTSYFLCFRRWRIQNDLLLIIPHKLLPVLLLIPSEPLEDYRIGGKKPFQSMFLKKGGKLQKIAISDYKNPLLVVLPHVLLHHPSEEQQLWNSRSKHSMVPWDHRREIIRGSWNLRTDV